MNALAVVSFILQTLLFQKTCAIITESDNLDCVNYQTVLVGNILGLLAKRNVKSETQTELLLATKRNPMSVNIKNCSWNDTLRAGLDASKKTYIIIHGFQSDSRAEWIDKFKEEILKKVDVNVLIVNWASYSRRWNYLDAVHATPKVRNETFTFLQELKMSYRLNMKNRSKVLWNCLYFIGHSLGAHLSGQIAHLLKKDHFYRVERITGLDPARPCFSDCNPILRLDKSHAEFVDVIHTQTGNLLTPGSFGAIDSLGHVDFYVNGGAMQPKCEGSYFFELKRMMCSHVIVTDYFLESIVNYKKTKTCKFIAYKWDRTYDDALKTLEKRRDQAESCSNCPEMGFGASIDKGTGDYLVFTGITTPHCRFTDSQIDHLLLGKSLERLNIRNNSDVDDPYEKFYLTDGNNV